MFNPGFGLAQSIQDVVAVASNTTYTGHCPESGRQKKLAEIVLKHFHVFKHRDLGHSADWSMSRSAVCLLPNFHNHGNAVGQSEILPLPYGQASARLCGTKNRKILVLTAVIIGSD